MKQRSVSGPLFFCVDFRCERHTDSGRIQIDLCLNPYSYIY
jgi:hypothetical protein